MIVFHGTTDKAARRIAEEGFLPRRPSKRVWFAAGRGYATGRAKTKARRAHARPIVLTCEVNLGRLRETLGRKKVRHKNGIIAVDGPVPASVLRSGIQPLDTPSEPKELAEWINGALRLKSHKGVSPKHPGLLRLSRWVVNRLRDRRRGIEKAELLHMARQWLGEFFEGVEIDPENLHVYRSVEVAPAVEPPEPPADPREDEAMALLEDGGAKQRVRALGLLAELDDPDLFEWCAMHLDDESPDVQVAALHAMLRCDDFEHELVEPLAEDEDVRVRGAAIANLAAHGAAETVAWFERGLKDPSPCVRLETARALPALDPAEHRAVFQLALYDPNPKIAQAAEKLIAGKGFPKVTWGLGVSHYPDDALC